LPWNLRQSTSPIRVRTSRQHRAPNLARLTAGNSISEERSTAMQTLEQACTPRQSVFDPAIRDTVDSIDALNSLDANQFFAENYITDGMKQLLTEVFKRLEGNSQSSSG